MKTLASLSRKRGIKVLRSAVTKASFSDGRASSFLKSVEKSH